VRKRAVAMIVEVDHLHKTYGSFVAVEDVSFSVEEGEIFGILGPNGAGKTTTVECLQGLRRPDGGDIEVAGFDPRSDPGQLRKQIGSQLQESALPDRMKVWEALHLFSSRSGNGTSWETVLEEWGLAEKRNAMFASLSGGQQQRLFVALAVVNEPRLVFLDEMTTGLDPLSRRETWGLIRKIRANGTTVVLVTHFMDEAETLCDRIAVIDDRRVVALDTVAGLIDRYGGPTTVTFSTDAADVGFLDRIPGVTGVHREGMKVEVSGTGALLIDVAMALGEHGITPTDVDVKRASLEDVFLTITGGGG
jgi:ABC-2 type transport system ATP-binding protein